jgi:RimJ/RimL family protein N-acetyltransferase
MSTTASIRLSKAHRVMGKTIAFRNAAVEDASFILTLRTDVDKSRYLSPVSGGLVEQQAWLEQYAQADDQAYFIIEYLGLPIGTVRLYDPQGGSFCWGSWVLNSNRPAQAAMESALMVYAYAVDHLGFAAAHFDVRKGNERVWKFHERFGAVRTAQSNLDYFYRLDGEAIAASRERYRRFLEGSVSVVCI